MHYKHMGEGHIRTRLISAELGYIIGKLVDCMLAVLTKYPAGHSPLFGFNSTRLVIMISDFCSFCLDTGALLIKCTGE